MATAMIFGAGAGAGAVAAERPANAVEHRAPSPEDDDWTGIGLNILCGIGVLGVGYCSN
ncbi:hypothetical protein [Streptomyces luteolus]|uniref:Uncharacterized protein n=1 Tax=Streptomyces luteolus TaxID=3043615 RepID=A0ABT6T2Z0_9ACTN|nr:hypothetical protein [Streptomyces sp. B-S-A12]MDI3422241.1 hypothetical protein [Streptomyces sp. B-S-A12]